MGALWTSSRLEPGQPVRRRRLAQRPLGGSDLARGLPRTTDFASLEVGVQPFGPGAKGGTMQHMCYAGSNQPVPRSTARRACSIACSAPIPTRPTAPSNGCAPSAAVSSIGSRREVTAAGAAGIARDDRQKLQSHLEGVRAIERRLESRPPDGLYGAHPGRQLDLGRQRELSRADRCRSRICWPRRSPVTAPGSPACSGRVRSAWSATPGWAATRGITPCRTTRTNGRS